MTMIPFMSMAIILASETLPTMFALVRFVPSMGVHMTWKVALADRALSEKDTDIIPS
jgi:hypothetical protein